MENKIKKNDYYTMTINDIGEQGEGIGKINGYTLFVNNSIIGDIIKVKVIKVKKNYGYGRLIDIIKPSPYRIEPVCNISNRCGGCQVQSLSYQKQLKYKQNKVENILKRLSGLKQLNIKNIIGMDKPYYYRNKSQYPVGCDNQGNIIIGFYANKSHNIIQNEKCYIGNPINEVILQKIKEYMQNNNVKAYDENKHNGLIRHVLIRVAYYTNQIMVCIVINGNKLINDKELINSLKEIPNMASVSININKEKTNIILGRDVRLLWGKLYIEDYIGKIKYQISPLSFYQVNSIQLEKLYDKVLEFADLTGVETVWDLYCGIGTISLFLAQKAKKVYGVEIVKEAIEDAMCNAQINNIDNVEFYIGKVEEILPKKYNDEKIQADVIVVDPPRKGCDQLLLDTIIKIKPKRIVYVSCNPATLARDLKYLVDKEYEVIKVQPVDMFPQTVHVETIVALYKKD